MTSLLHSQVCEWISLQFLGLCWHWDFPDTGTTQLESWWRHQMEFFYWPFVWGINLSPVNSPNKDQWCGALIFSLICAWINDWVNNREAGDLRCHHAHYDVIVMMTCLSYTLPCQLMNWWYKDHDVNTHGFELFLLEYFYLSTNRVNTAKLLPDRIKSLTSPDFITRMGY